MLATRTPWLGLELTPDPQGIRVVAVVPQGPSGGLLAPGDVLASLRTTNGEEIPLAGDLVLDGPFAFPTYAGYNTFFERYEVLFPVIAAGSATFILSDRREVSVTAADRRPVAHLPLMFWVIAGVGVLALQVGIGIWAFRWGQPAARLVAISSAAYMLSGLCIATYATREWLLAPDLFRWLANAGHLGNVVFGYTAMALVWYHPRPLGRFPISFLFLLTAALFWLNEVFQLIEWPLQTFALQYFPAFAAGVWFARWQWVATRSRPDQRAALFWIVGPGLISIGIVMTLYFLPQLLGVKRIIPYWAGQFLVLGLYVGIVLGVLRFRLFDLDRWWFAIWTWFFGGLLVVLVDVGLVYYANVSPIGALAISLLLIGWVYFPIRQWAWGWFMRSSSQGVEKLLPVLLETFFATSTNKQLGERWQGLLARIFAPLSVRTAPAGLASPRLEEDGLVLAVPDIDGQGHVRLSGRSRGRRLFSRDDVNLATFILTLALKSAALREAQERGAAVERERIARDLHDDVAPQLLTLAHASDSPQNAERARNALQTLRESIYSLSDPHELPLETVLAEWRIEAADRAEAAGVDLLWQQPEQLPAAVSLTSRQRLNLGRVLREALTNALRHAGPTMIDIAVEIVGQELAVRLLHDGNIALPETWLAGKGLNNMRVRIAELGGRIEWALLPQPRPALAISWEAPLGQPALSCAPA